MRSRPFNLFARVRRLEAQCTRQPQLPDVAREWQDVARISPEAHRRAVALTALMKAKWTDRIPSVDECFNDSDCFEHVLYLAAVREGGLANFLAPVLTEH